jgi:hypothetical protein
VARRPSRHKDVLSRGEGELKVEAAAAAEAGVEEEGPGRARLSGRKRRGLRRKMSGTTTRSGRASRRRGGEIRRPGGKLGAASRPHPRRFGLGSACRGRKKTIPFSHTGLLEATKCLPYGSTWLRSRTTWMCSRQLNTRATRFHPSYI